jgi:hypothetical protein
MTENTTCAVDYPYTCALDEDHDSAHNTRADGTGIRFAQERPPMVRVEYLDDEFDVLRNGPSNA